MASTQRDQERRSLAWIDFCNLEHEGIKPNPNALYEFYINLNREHPEQRSRIPTTNRSQIYVWAKEDKWIDRYQEMKKLEASQKAEQYAGVQKRAFGQLVSLQGLAIETLTQLASNSNRDPKTRLAAAESILDRTGLARQPARPTKEDVTDKPEMARANPLPDDATEEQLLEFIANNGGSSLNA